jgi:hypothetical protein
MDPDDVEETSGSHVVSLGKRPPDRHGNDHSPENETRPANRPRHQGTNVEASRKVEGSAGLHSRRRNHSDADLKILGSEDDDDDGDFDESSQGDDEEWWETSYHHLHWDTEIGPPFFVRFDEEGEEMSIKEHCLETLFLFAVDRPYFDFGANFMGEPGLSRADFMAKIVRDYGGNGDILWTRQENSYSVFQDEDEDQIEEELYLIEICFRDMWPDDEKSLFIRKIVAENPRILRNDSARGPRTLFHVAVKHGAPFDLVELVASPEYAALTFDGYVNLPLHEAAISISSSVQLVEFLVGLNRRALETRGSGEQLPLHCFCQFLASTFGFDDDEEPRDTSVVELLINEYCAGLLVRDFMGYTPVVTALEEADLRIVQQPKVLRLLKDMVLRAPESIRVSAVPLPRTPDRPDSTAIRVVTALSLSCIYCPHTPLVSFVFEQWPVAACVCYVHDYDGELPCELLESNQDSSQDIKDLIDVETTEVTLALLEVLLLDTTWAFIPSVQHRIQEAIRIHAPAVELRGQIHSYVTSEAIRSLDPSLLASLRPGILKTDPLQQLLRESGPLCDFVSGVYSMNKAGRSASRPGTSASPVHQVRILETTKDNLDCLFLHLRQSPCLFRADQASA